MNRPDEEIVSGARPPAERLVEETLSSQFATSRTPGRQVRRILEAKGDRDLGWGGPGAAGNHREC